MFPDFGGALVITILLATIWIIGVFAQKVPIKIYVLMSILSLAVVSYIALVVIEIVKISRFLIYIESTIIILSFLLAFLYSNTEIQWKRISVYVYFILGVVWTGILLISFVF